MVLLPLLLAVAVAQTAGAGAEPSAPPPPSPPPAVTAEVREPAAPPPVAAPAPASPPRLVRVTMKDGQVLTGRLAAQLSNGDVTLELGTGARLELPAASIAQLEDETRSYRTASGDTWFLDANRTRYLYSPSAMMLKQGETSFSELELLVSTFNWGVTDWLSVQIGGSVPFWFVANGFNLVGAVKVGGQVAERVHVAGGAQTLVIPNLGGQGSGPLMAGVAFGTVTFGDRDAHATLSAAVPFAASAGTMGGSTIGFNTPIFTLCADYRVHRSAALITENWLILPVSNPAEFVTIETLAVRVLSEKIAVDLGFAWAVTRQGLATWVPVPWVGFTYNFF